MRFAPGGKYFAGDFVDEGKLPLFIKEEVASRAPRTGKRLAAKKKRKAAAQQADRIYVSAINELWAHNTSRGLHAAPRPYRVALKALTTSIIRVRHARRRFEFADRGVGTIRDWYTAKQIPDLTHAVWSCVLGGDKTIEMSFRTPPSSNGSGRPSIAHYDGGDADRAGGPQRGPGCRKEGVEAVAGPRPHLSLYPTDSVKGISS